MINSSNDLCKKGLLMAVNSGYYFLAFKEKDREWGQEITGGMNKAGKKGENESKLGMVGKEYKSC